MVNSVFINSRFISQKITGVQRYGHGILSYLQNTDRIRIQPDQRRIGSHFEEQVMLPLRMKQLGSPLLLNFCNTAPAFYHNQIATIHDMAVFKNPGWFRKDFALWYQWLMPHVARAARHVVTVSEFSKREIVKFTGVSTDKVSVIPSAVSDVFTRVKPVRPRTLRNDHFLLMVGSLDPRKNMSFACRALQNWCSDTLSIIVIAGNVLNNFPDVRDAGFEHIQHLPALTDEELSWLYRHAKVVIHPSLYEGFSLVPLEAASLGTPVVLSDIPVHREVHGEGGVYFDPTDTRTLVAAVERAASDPRPTHQANRYSFEKSGQLWERLVLKTLEQSCPDN